MSENGPRTIFPSCLCLGFAVIDGHYLHAQVIEALADRP